MLTKLASQVEFHNYIITLTCSLVEYGNTHHYRKYSTPQWRWQEQAKMPCHSFTELTPTELTPHLPWSPLTCKFHSVYVFQLYVFSLMTKWIVIAATLICASIWYQGRNTRLKHESLVLTRLPFVNGICKHVYVLSESMSNQLLMLLANLAMFSIPREKSYYLSDFNIMKRGAKVSLLMAFTFSFTTVHFMPCSMFKWHVIPGTCTLLAI